MATVQAKEVRKRYGGVDILVNNAGVVFGRSLSDCRIEEVQYTINVNLVAQFLVRRHLIFLELNLIFVP